VEKKVLREGETFCSEGDISREAGHQQDARPASLSEAAGRGLARHRIGKTTGYRLQTRTVEFPAATGLQ